MFHWLVFTYIIKFNKISRTTDAAYLLTYLFWLIQFIYIQFCIIIIIFTIILYLWWFQKPNCSRYTGILKSVESRNTTEEFESGKEEATERYKHILAENKANMLQEYGFYFEDFSNGNDVLLRMNTIRKEGHFCDAILNIQSHSLPIHKIVLASSSVFFFELFSKSDGCNGQLQYNLETSNMDFNSLQLIINYFYTSKLSIFN